MAQIGGEVAAKRRNPSSSGEDRLSALPDDILVLILLGLGTISEAVRTSVLSLRWRRIWTLLPNLTFNSAASSSAPKATPLILWRRGSPSPRAASPVVFCTTTWWRSTRAVRRRVSRPSLPSSGAFTGLTVLSLKSIWFQGPCELGDVLSSPRCPVLRKLMVCGVRGLARLAIQSESLLTIHLQYLNELQQLSIDASALKELRFHSCFVENQPVANISAPQLVSLKWRGDAYDPSSVHLVNLGQLQKLNTNIVLGSRQRYVIHNRGVLQLLNRFQGIHSLYIALCYGKKIQNIQFLTEQRKVLCNVAFLKMSVLNRAHSFGACSFHVLRLCAGIRRLSLLFEISRNFEAQSTCPSGCFCDQPTNWKTEELSLNCLQEVEITGLRGAEHEVFFLKLLFNWVATPEKMRVTFDYSISKSRAKELCQKLSSFSKPETCVQFYMFQNYDRNSVHLLSLEDEGTGVLLMVAAKDGNSGPGSGYPTRWGRAWGLFSSMGGARSPPRHESAKPYVPRARSSVSTARAVWAD
ncbi:hypothetical protein EJB05_13893, partial [Eragrostis curvula]